MGASVEAFLRKCQAFIAAKGVPSSDFPALLQMRRALGPMHVKDAHTAWVHALATARHTQGMLSAIEDMRKAGLRVNSAVYGRAFQALTLHSDFAACEQLLMDMKAHGAHANTAMFNMMMQTWTKVSTFRKCAELLSEMKVQNEEEPDGTPSAPPSASHTTQFVPKATPLAVDQLLRESKGPGAMPNVATYNIMLETALSEGRDYEGLMMEMKQNGLEPNLRTYNTLISGLSRTGKLNECVKVLGEMHARYLKPDVITYNALIHVHAQAHDLKACEAFFAHMKKRSIAPSIVTYNTMITAYNHAGDREARARILVEMRKNNVVPNEVTLKLFNDTRDAKVREELQKWSTKVE